MNITVRTILLAAAVVLFVIGLFVGEGDVDELLLLGLAAFAGAWLVDDLGVGGRIGTRT
jgi:hypothetical protein